MSAVLHRGMPRATYDALDRVSCTQLKRIARSPLQFQHALLNPADSAAFVFGRCFDMRVLEPESYASKVAVYEGAARRGKAWEEFKASTKAEEILTVSEAEEIEAMAEALEANERVAPYLVGESQISIEWESEGVMLKSRLDLVGANGAAGDLKTARDASAGAFGRAALDLGYLTQAAMYVDALAQVEGSPRPFWLLAVEKEAPYESVLYVLSEDALEYGRREYRRLLGIYRACREAQRWPGYEPIQFLALPRWSGITSEE